MVPLAPVNWDEYKADGVAAFAAATDADAVEDVRIRFLGRKSALPLALREVRDRETGMLLNTVRKALEAAAEEAEARLAAGAGARGLDFDPTEPSALHGTALPVGSLHPITRTRREIEDVFLGLGYEVIDGREVENTKYNFDALNFPDWHPARSPLASLFFDRERLLRTETSPSQIRTMETRKPPIYMVSHGRVYRRDSVDATHYPVFHQIEGLAIDKGLTLADLKGTLLHLMRALFGNEREVRFRTHYFPFTEPSMEPDVSCFLCNGAGCRVCKQSGWIEMGGSGMVDPKLFEFVGYDPEEYTGFAFGLGIERIVQLRHGVPDIRLLWHNDLRVLRQF
jgi:phenylalanyl-tRNA synthetase alpha chain